MYLDWAEWIYQIVFKSAPCMKGWPILYWSSEAKVKENPEQRLKGIVNGPSKRILTTLIIYWVEGELVVFHLITYLPSRAWHEMIIKLDLAMGSQTSPRQIK